MESAGELELDLHSIVEWGDSWLVTFNATKPELLSFNRHRDPLGECGDNGIELPEETSFHLLGLTFYGLEVIYNPLPRLVQGKWAPFMYGVVLQGPMGLIC